MAAFQNPLGSVLVIGGNGFLGTHIARQLLEIPSTSVSVLDLFPPRRALDKVSYHTADITSADAVRAIFALLKPDVVIHTASPPPVAGGSYAHFAKVNVGGTANLLACAAEAGVKAFVYTSSASVLHDTVSDLINADERWPVLTAPVQREPYSDSKGAAETLVLAANTPGAMLTAAIRPSGIFGEGDTSLVPSMHDAFLKGQTRFQLGDNDNLFDFTYVGNVAYAHLLAARALLATRLRGVANAPLDHERVDGEAFLITNDAPLYFWDFARLVWRLAGDETQVSDVWVIPRGIGLPLATLMEWVVWVLSLGSRQPKLTRRIVNYSCMTRTYSIEKARRRLGYSPVVGIEEGLRRTMLWLGEVRGGLGRGAVVPAEVKKVQ